MTRTPTRPTFTFRFVQVPPEALPQDYGSYNGHYVDADSLGEARASLPTPYAGHTWELDERNGPVWRGPSTKIVPPPGDTGVAADALERAAQHFTSEAARFWALHDASGEFFSSEHGYSDAAVDAAEIAHSLSRAAKILRGL